MSRRMLPLVVLTFALGCLTALAAPILPGSAKLPPEVQSLAGIEKVELIVQGASPLVNDPTYLDNLRQTITAVLEQGGVKVGKGADLPRLNIVLFTAISPAQPDVVGYTYHLSLEQQSTVERLNKSLLLPTYALIHTELSTRQRLQEDTRSVVPMLMNHFLSRIQLANNDE